MSHEHIKYNKQKKTFPVAQNGMDIEEKKIQQIEFEEMNLCIIYITDMLYNNANIQFFDIYPCLLLILSAQHWTKKLCTVTK